MRFVIPISALFLLFLIAIVLIPRKGDRGVLEKLLLASKDKKEMYLRSKQDRKGVLKEVWMGDRYLRIEAPTSSLYLLAGDRDAIEELEGFQAYLYQSNRVSEFAGEKGELYYQSKSFQGSRVHFSEEPLFSGIAENMRLSLKEGNISLTASQIEAAYNDDVK